MTQVLESRIGCIGLQFARDSLQAQAQAQATTSASDYKLNFIKVISNRVPIAGKRVRRIGAKG